jgi:hypothetical protein
VLLPPRWQPPRLRHQRAALAPTTSTTSLLAVSPPRERDDRVHPPPHRPGPQHPQCRWGGPLRPTGPARLHHGAGERQRHLTTRYAYSPYGRPPSRGHITQPFRYTGQPRPHRPVRGGTALLQPRPSPLDPTRPLTPRTTNPVRQHLPVRRRQSYQWPQSNWCGLCVRLRYWSGHECGNRRGDRGRAALAGLVGCGTSVAFEYLSNVTGYESLAYVGGALSAAVDLAAGLCRVVASC